MIMTGAPGDEHESTESHSQEGHHHDSRRKSWGLTSPEPLKSRCALAWGCILLYWTVFGGDAGKVSFAYSLLPVNRHSLYGESVALVWLIWPAVEVAPCQLGMVSPHFRGPGGVSWGAPLVVPSLCCVVHALWRAEGCQWNVLLHRGGGHDIVILAEVIIASGKMAIKERMNPNSITALFFKRLQCHLQTLQ